MKSSGQHLVAWAKNFMQFGAPLLANLDASERLHFRKLVDARIVELTAVLCTTDKQYLEALTALDAKYDLATFLDSGRSYLSSLNSRLRPPALLTWSPARPDKCSGSLSAKTAGLFAGLFIDARTLRELMLEAGVNDFPPDGRIGLTPPHQRQASTVKKVGRPP